MSLSFLTPLNLLSHLLSRDIAFQLQQERMVKALKQNQPVCFLPFFKHSLVENRQFELLTTLDNGEGGRSQAGALMQVAPSPDMIHVCSGK